MVYTVYTLHSYPFYSINIHALISTIYWIVPNTSTICTGMVESKELIDSIHWREKGPRTGLLIVPQRLIPGNMKYKRSRLDNLGCHAMVLCADIYDRWAGRDGEKEGTTRNETKRNETKHANNKRLKHLYWTIATCNSMRCDTTVARIFDDAIVLLLLRACK